MIDDESPAGPWKQAIEWMKSMKNDAPDYWMEEARRYADNADYWRERAEQPEDYRNRAERAEAECRELRAKLDRIYYILKEY